MNKFMTYFDQFRCCFDIFIFVIKSKLPETFEETVYTFDSFVIPFGIKLWWSYEEFVNS